MPVSVCVHVCVCMFVPEYVVCVYVQLCSGTRVCGGQRLTSAIFVVLHLMFLKQDLVRNLQCQRGGLTSISQGLPVSVPPVPTEVTDRAVLSGFFLDPNLRFLCSHEKCFVPALSPSTVLIE